jgi:cytochrome c oxidase subunit I+III
MASRYAMSERLGRWSFALLFVGINVTFFPMHLTGLIGMPRRVYTYPEGLGWDALNMTSTVGAFVAAAGVALFVLDLARNFRPTFSENVGNIWNAGTLEWLPTEPHQTRSIPLVTSREPLWDRPSISAEVEQGRWYLPGTLTGGRETLVTSPIEAVPQYILRVPGDPSWSPFVAAVFTAAFFMLLTVQWYVTALFCGAASLASVLIWMWHTDPEPLRKRFDIGGGIRLPAEMTGPSSHSWWATVTFLLVAGSLFASLVFAYFFIWTVNPEGWPPQGAAPGLLWPGLAALLYILGSSLVALAGRRLESRGSVALAFIAAVALLVAGFAMQLLGPFSDGLRPAGSAFAALTYAFVALQGQYVFAVVVMGLFTVARALAGKIDGERRQTYDNSMLVWHYSTAQGLAALTVTTLFPLAMA